MRIAIAAPIASADLVALLQPQPGVAGAGAGLPAGYLGAPLTATLIAELLRMGHEVVAITVDYRLAGRAAVLAHGPGLALHILPGRRHAWRFNGLLPGRALDQFALERRAIAAVLAQAQPDVVHAHWTYEFALAAIASGLPHVITAHDSPQALLRLARGPYLALRAWMARRVLRQARLLTAVSEGLADALRADVWSANVWSAGVWSDDARAADARAKDAPGGAARRPRVVPNPVAPFVQRLGRARGAASGKRIAMICNGWGRWKNPEPALRAFALLRARLPGAELHLFGLDFGPGEQAQQWAMQRVGVAGMHFHGHLPHAGLIERLAALDVLLHPALEESFGVVLAEAMALGLPVVAGAHSGAVPWVLGPGQWLVDVRSPQAMADALIEVLGDAERYALASKAGRARAAQAFGAAAVAEAYLALYRQALATQGGVQPLQVKPC